MTQKKEKPQPSKLKRVITAVFDALPSVTGYIKEHDFTATNGAMAKFKRVDDETIPDGFYIIIPNTSHYWDLQELRDFADEITKMADYIEKKGRKELRPKNATGYVYISS